MIKKITIVVAWILVAGIFKVSAQDVTVDLDLPASAAPETTFRVTLKVNKGDVSGFAKLEQILPAGLEATSVDVANSTFSFKERKVKFLWMSLPAETSFTVSYDVKVAAGTSGNQILEGTFAYIFNNETQKYALPKGIINISAAQTASSEVKTNIVETPHNNPEAEKAKAEAEAKAAADAAAKSAEAKAKQDATATEKANAELAASIKKKMEEEKKAADAAAAAAKKQQQQEAKQQQQEVKKETVKTEVAVKEGKPVDGLVFRAQVAAGKKKVSPSVFQAEFKITEEIFWEEHEGWNKYTVGNFNSYRAAKTFANDIRDNNGVTGSFVVAYNNGTRISVQEALNIAGGK